MSRISALIPNQAYELIRDRIAEILIDELANQHTLSIAASPPLGEPVLGASVFTERTKPFDKSELAAVNVSVARGNYEGGTVVDVDGAYDYNIDCYVSSKATSSERGDVISMLKLHRLLGVIRAILSDAQYKTLGYSPGFITRRTVTEFSVADPKNDDAWFTTIGRLVLRVQVPENVALKSPTLAEGYDTTVKLGETDKGYIYTGADDPITACELLLAGLTEDQLNTCILPNYDFTDPVVLANLTVQQIEDLEDSIGGGSVVIRNSNGTFQVTVEAEDSPYTLPDTTINVLFRGATVGSVTIPTLS